MLKGEESAAKGEESAAMGEESVPKGVDSASKSDGHMYGKAAQRYHTACMYACMYVCMYVCMYCGTCVACTMHWLYLPS